MIQFAFILFGLALKVSGEVLWQCDYFDPDASDIFDQCEWNNVSYVANYQNLAIVPDPAEPDGDNYVLRAFYPNGSYAGNSDGVKGGFEFFAQPVEPAEELELSYEIYFSENFDWVYGGKLPGLYGGYVGEVPAPGELICAGGNRRPDCFSTRYMWRNESNGEIYAYFPGDEGYGRPIGLGTWQFRIGEWQKITQRLRMSTPGEEDGMVQIFYNGELAHEEFDAPIREVEGVQIDTLFFSTFFGGSTSIDWASNQDCYAYFRNFEIAD